MARIDKTLADVLAVAGFEEVRFESGCPFRCWCSPDLTARLFVFEREEQPCVWVFHDEADQPFTRRGSSDEALHWLLWRPEYRRAMLSRFAS